MPSKCPACGEDAVINDTEAAGGNEVCTACGVVSESCPFPTTSTGPCEGTAFVAPTKGNDSTMFLARSGKSSSAGVRRVNARNNLRGNSKEGCNWVHQTARHFNLDTHMARRAEAMYVELVEKMGRTAPQRKTALAAACCYVVLRQDHWPVSLKAVGGFVQCSLAEVNAAVRYVQKVMGAEFSRTSAEDLLPSVLKNYGGDDSNRVLLRARELLKLAKVCWLGEGCAPQNVSAATVYIAWKSLDPRRTTSSYKDFCKTAGTNEAKSAKDMVTAFTKALVKLTRNVPWLASKNVSARSVFLHLPDVLRHKASLVLDCSVLHADDSKVAETGRDKVVYDTFRPPSTSKPAHADTAAEECNSDFSDSEIDRYIRSPEDVDAIKKHMTIHGLYDRKDCSSPSDADGASSDD